MVSEWCCQDSSYCKWLHWHTVFIHKYWMNWIFSVNGMIFVKKVIWWLLMSLNGARKQRTSVGIPSWGSAVLTPTIHSLTHAVLPVGKIGLSPNAWKGYLLPSFAVCNWCRQSVAPVWVNSTHCSAVAYPGIFFGGRFNKFSWGQRERGSGGGSPLVRGSGGSCNLVKGISFHIVKFSQFLVLPTIYDDNQFICHF